MTKNKKTELKKSLEKTLTLHEKLNKIQQDLKAPKNQRNSFANFNYRSCEDILEAVKPLLNGLVLTISDEVVSIGDRFYVKATVKISDGKEEIKNTAYAREQLVKKGMDEAQITGATSSYSRKYALNGLFLIDDTKDSDTTDNSSDTLDNLKAQVDKITDIDELRSFFADNKGNGAEFDKYIVEKSKLLKS